MDSHRRQIAITGASGLIGAALVDSLRRSGHRPISLVRRAPQTGADEIRWDPARSMIDALSMESLDAVVHLGGAGIGDKRWSGAHKKLILESRVQGTHLLATTLANLDRPPAVFVSASATGFYGSRGSDPLDESATQGSGFLAGVVSDWEAAAQPARDADIRTVFARTSVVLTPDGGALNKQLRLFKIGLGGRVGPGTQYMPWITLTDEIRALEFVMGLGDNDGARLRGPVNLCAPNPVTNLEFTKALGAVLRRPTFLPVPLAGPRLLFGSDFVDELLLASQRAVPAVLTAAGFSFEHESIEPALRAILT